MKIIVRYEVSAARRYESAVKQIVNQAVKIIQCPRNVAISISFIGDKKMRAINKKYRGKDKTTNVLSFSTLTPTPLPGGEGRVRGDLGDIFISFPEARREAKKYGWIMRYEIARLVLHGFLHLLGYDHEEEKEAKQMEKVEEKVLRKFT
ncbi:rRNA maturation RNase YbeY [Candidatus Uhrbacteria bacterium RIFCSPLOWO2_01_FULL_47_24]|uniref:Endoribonuclease YbeY n=1 Tax=Candidatus Uhrbacteria bacterium RIFCSPLOWO2_01_FULL_47_24 TaxID=1802401 RepID=A0A1F7UPK4_9BACT|nr:MAG: rRNA maturation RNase YbeY [Candidatus Uhrbacteria bacterium RIFCSPHIGHO2_01_FULL_47_11]OGL68087.1 MAG: rRNA maturation RNase YbeY [Candidatus Uhrbacteria bacterium RIFCSPHIGHO2_02_FULL_46_47]OGL75462.1 MAG: rRNA maturation RNase YbeY [Candidatus Uhrbacteria bacterium RIFCSPHIGHO2_12_FULL_47_11]OGL80179.1 MAG: rRNA maturation RNase YbeY [Candidatus Uhrbacteria bacterium RIFCSPLOWO2_01_FULL_47_24]OGL84965.1 MAG: rRNA maturation RNase YbeY [Candidatus Uhrbacteria bacterium RIFCSPLOWO2_02_